MKQHSYTLRNGIPLFLVLCLMSFASILRGQTIYTGPANGDWSTAANWSNGLPALGNEPTVVGGTTVCINGTLAINYAVTNFGSIINKGTTTLTGSINSGGALENQSVFTIAAGATMTSSGGFTNSGTVTNNGNVNSNSALTNAATGVFNNFSIWSQNGACINNGIMSNKAGTFSCPSLLTNNKTVENLTGATWKIDFGGNFTNAVGSTLSNAGTFQNLGTFNNGTTVTNTGTFTNNGTQTCTGIFNNESGGKLESTATINLSGRLNNKLGGTVTSSFNFNVLANGYVSNAAQFTNSNTITVSLGGTFCNETLSLLTGQFGSSIVNAGYFKVSASSTVTTNGSINNSRKLDVYGSYDAMGGGQIINSDSLCNYGLVKNVNVINNSGVWKNFGTTENNSGGVWTNTKTIENNKGGVISNNYEILNKLGANIINNGTFLNNIRIFNEGTVTNNAYFVVAGDFLNKVGGSLVNTEVFVIREGSIQNDGTVSNQKTMINEKCSIITNRAGATINNTGRFENRGIIFQRGTVTGAAILAVGGYTQGAGSSAPSLCLTTLTTGTDALGEAKVYGQSGFKAGIGIDECTGFQYFANGVNRFVYTCPQIGLTLNTNFKILTRTGDSLTCVVPTTIFDNVAPVVANCPKDATIYTTQNTATYSWPTVTGIDNCGDVPTVTSTNASGSAFPLGITQVTISVKDSHANTTDCIFKLNVVKIVTTATCPAVDAAAPVFANCPASQTIATTGPSAVVVWNAPSVTDNCYPVVVQQNLNSGIQFPVGTNTVSYTAKDPTGNVGTCSFTVTVNGPADVCTVDPIKPVIANCPANFFGTVNAAINGAVGYWAAPSATDNCGGGVTLTGSAVSGSIFNIGTTVVTYTATDAKNNTSTCSFNVNVAAANPCAGDVTGPVLTCPANVAVNSTSTTATATWTAPTPTDACSPVVLNGSHQPGNTFVTGTTTVTYCASDYVGNSSKCTFNVVVSNSCSTDAVAPVLTACPANQTVIASNGSNATATWTAPTATDNCALAGVTGTFASGSSFNVGTTNVVYTASDVKGNTATCSFTITVTGVSSTCSGGLKGSYFTNNALTGTPALVRTEGINFEWGVGSPDPIIPVDNFSVRWEGQIFAPVSGVYTFKTTTDDGVRLSVNNTLLIDKWIPQAPTPWTGTITLVAGQKYPITMEYNEFTGGATAQLAWSYPGQTEIVVPTTYLCQNVDPCIAAPSVGGTVSPATQSITLAANGIVPTFHTVAGYVGTIVRWEWQSPNSTVWNNWNGGGSATAPNNCCFSSVGTWKVRAIVKNGACVEVPSSEGSIIVSDQCATDAIAPVLTACPASQSVTTTNNACKIVTWTAPTATDNCSTPSVTSTQASGFCFPVGTTTVIYTATDAKLNKSTCSFNVTVTNTGTPPVSCTGNLIANFSFESDLTGFNNWGNTVVSTTDARSGAKAAKIGLAAGGFGYSQAATPLATYTFRSWNKLTGTISSAAVGVSFYDANWAKVANEIYIGVTGTTYAETVVTTTAPANAVYVVSWAWSNGTAGYMITDDWCLTVKAPPVCPTLAAGKCYRLVNKLSGKVLGIEGLNSNDNTFINQYTYNTTPNLQWQITPNANGSYKIINQYSKDILACHLTADGSRAYQWQNIDNNAKYWFIEHVGNCEYRIKNEFSGKYLDNISNGSAEGGQIGISAASNGADQVWRFEEVTCAPNCFSGGNIVVDRWYTYNWNFPITLPTTAPNITNYQGNTQGPWNIGDGYTSRVRGYICPQTTGVYQFNVTGDDNVELFVSTNAMAGSMTRVAYINGWTSELEYAKYPSQTSSNITLQANQLYYFELRHVEGGGGDGWRMSWKTPTNATWQPIQSQFLARSCNTTYSSASQAIFEFNAKADYKVAKLQWVSNGGLNNDFYGVEKADEKGEFKQIGIVNANTANDAPTVFDFTDANPTEGDNFYRIKTVDNGGKETLSSIKTVNFSNIGDAKVFPNPANDVLNIDLKAFEGRAVGIQVYNAMGKLILVQQVEKAGSSPIQVSTSDMPVGSYLVRLLPEGKREVTKQVKIAR
jgi:hypothetical protein